MDFCHIEEHDAMGKYGYDILTSGTEIWRDKANSRDRFIMGIKELVIEVHLVRDALYKIQMCRAKSSIGQKYDT